jgi:hypothetical protein
VEDRFGGELTVVEDSSDAIVTTSGNSAKPKLTWTVGDLGPGEKKSLALMVSTDVNPGGQQEYSSPGGVLRLGPSVRGLFGKLVKKGPTVNRVAELFDATRQTVHRWLKRAKHVGRDTSKTNQENRNQAR